MYTLTHTHKHTSAGRVINTQIHTQQPTQTNIIRVIQEIHKSGKWPALLINKRRPLRLQHLPFN